METNLKVHKIGTILECGCYVIIMALIGFMLYIRFCTDYLYKKVLVKRSSDALDYFFYHHPYYVLALSILIFVGFCLMLKKCLVYLYKGYIAQLSPEGIQVATGRFIPWYDIEYMDMGYSKSGKFTYIQIYTKPIQSRNCIDWFIKRLHRSVLLTNFERPQEVLTILEEYWEQYQ